MPANLEQAFFEQASQQYHEIINTLSSEDSQEWEHGELERYINEYGTEVLRLLFQGHLD